MEKTKKGNRREKRLPSPERLEYLKRWAKRRILRREAKQRGCLYCTDRVLVRAEEREFVGVTDGVSYERVNFCIHAVCPYHQLDGIKNYISDYDEPIAKRMRIGGLLKAERTEGGEV